MGERRTFLRTVGSVGFATLAGCATGSDVTEDSEKPSEEPQRTTSKPTATDTTPMSADPLPLPGTPVEEREGNIPVMRITAPKPEYTERGFHSEDAVSKPKFLKSEKGGGGPPPVYEVGMAGQHYGEGRASAVGVAAYQTAWQPPESGRYRLTVGYLRSDYYAYERPDHGRVGTTMDSHLVATRASDSTVVSRERKSELKYRSGELTEEALELFIETGLTLLVGRALGLRWVVKQVLGEAIDQLVEVEISDEMEEATDWRGVHELSTTFTATRGEYYLLEFNSTIGYNVDLDDSIVMPFLEMKTQPQWLRIERL